MPLYMKTLLVFCFTMKFHFLIYSKWEGRESGSQTAITNTTQRVCRTKDRSLATVARADRVLRLPCHLDGISCQSYPQPPSAESAVAIFSAGTREFSTVWFKCTVKSSSEGIPLRRSCFWYVQILSERKRVTLPRISSFSLISNIFVCVQIHFFGPTGIH